MQNGVGPTHRPGAVPVINYHFFTGGRSRGFACGLEDLETQLRFLQKHYRVVPLAEALERLENGSGTGRIVAITVDDGEETFYRIAWPVFRDMGVPIQVNIVAGSLGKVVHIHDIPARIMNGREAEEVRKSGLATFASHSMGHRKMGALSASELEYEIAESKRIVEDIGGGCAMFCYPYGGVDVVTEASERIVAAAGYRYALTTAGGTLSRGTDRFRISRINVEGRISPAHLRCLCSAFYYRLRALKNRLRRERFHSGSSVGGRIGDGRWLS